MASDDTSGGGVDPDKLRRVEERLQAEEESVRETAVSSLESFRLWMNAQGAQFVDYYHQFGPALFDSVRRLLGL